MSLALVPAAGLAVALVLAAASKLASPLKLASTLSATGVAASAARPVVVGAGLVEWMAALLLVLAPTSALTLGAVIALFAAFSVLGINALLRRLDVPCHCFGSLNSGRLGWGQIVQLPFAVAIAAWPVIQQPAVDPGSTAVCAVAVHLIAVAVLLIATFRKWLPLRAERRSLAAFDFFSNALAHEGRASMGS